MASAIVYGFGPDEDTEVYGFGPDEDTEVYGFDEDVCQNEDVGQDEGVYGFWPGVYEVFNGELDPAEVWTRSDLRDEKMWIPCPDCKWPSCN